MQRVPFSPMVLVLALLIGISLSTSTVSADSFPTYDNIRPNVSFWKKVYSNYPTTRAIVHDAINLDIIYDVIELKAADIYRARKINRKRMKDVKAKYQKILKLLATNHSTKKRDAQRVAKLFGPHASSNTYSIASRRIRCQIGQSDRFKTGLIRSGAYIDQIRTIFKSQGLPEKLAYLPHVESSFSYQAYSKFGAAGIWQFTRSTGKRFMKVGYELDERRDPIIATHAAAALLKKNYEKLGDWPLAITAYNHGAAGMMKAKQKYGTYPAIFDLYRSRSFKFASRNFYSEFLAAVQVASNYQAYFGDLPLDRPLSVQTANLEGYANIKDLCQHYNIPLDIAKSLNPALRPPVFNGQKFVPKGYAFRLPADLDLKALEVAAIPPSLYKDRQKPSLFYTVQRGDTADRIARTQGVNLSDLIIANNLSRRATIYPKQTLRIPVPGETNQDLKRTEPIAIAAIDEPKAQVSTIEGSKKEPSPPQPLLASMIPALSSRPMPTVALAKTRPVQKAITSAIDSAGIVSADVRFHRISSHPSKPTGTIQVEVEETLGHFAEWTGVRTQYIRRMNGLPFGKKLRLHQKLKIPLSKVTPQYFEEKRYEYHKRLQEDFFAVFRIGELHTHRVTRGDNLWVLSLYKFSIPMWLLKSCNPEVEFAALRLHQLLMIPTIEKITPDESEPGSHNETMDMDLQKNQYSIF